MIDGFSVLCCSYYGLRFGIMHDLHKGFVNTDGKCVPMKTQCDSYETSH